MYFDRENFYDFTSLVILIYGLFIFDRFSFRILLIKCRHLQVGCQKCEIRLLVVKNQFDLKTLDLDRSLKFCNAFEEKTYMMNAIVELKKTWKP
ncbi:hypothetical protein Hanom_Chr15g01400171 [Helianthus anomalus]